MALASLGFCLTNNPPPASRLPLSVFIPLFLARAVACSWAGFFGCGLVQGSSLQSSVSARPAAEKAMLGGQRWCRLPGVCCFRPRIGQRGYPNGDGANRIFSIGIICPEADTRVKKNCAQQPCACCPLSCLAGVDSLETPADRYLGVQSPCHVFLPCFDDKPGN